VTPKELYVSAKVLEKLEELEKLLELKNQENYELFRKNKLMGEKIFEF